MALQVKAQSNPSAGADWVATVPAGKYWRLKAVYAVLVSSVAAANRIAKIFIDDGANRYWITANETAQTASIACAYCISPGAGMEQAPIATATARTYPLPDQVVLSPGHRVGSFTGGIQAGDQWNGIQLRVEETSQDPTLQPD